MHSPSRFPHRLLLLIALGGLATSADALQQLTLQDAVAIAQEQNPALLAARQQLGEARGRLEKARYWNRFNPELEGQGGHREFVMGGSGVVSFGSVSLEVEVAGQRGKRIEEAEHNIERIRAEIADAERMLLAEVRESFYRALYLRRRLELLHEVEDRNRRLRDLAAQQFEAGEVPKIEANLAAVRHVQSRKETLAAERDYRNAVRELERQLGREPAGTTQPTGDLAPQPVELEVEELVRIALQVRPDLRAHEAAIEQAEAKAALTKRLILPNPAFSAWYEEEPDPGGDRERTVGGGLRIALPVFDRNQAELTALAAEQARARHDRNAAVLEVQGEVRSAYDTWQAAREAVEIFESDAADRITESHRLAEAAHREGNIDLHELASIERQLLRIQLSHLESRWDYWVALVALERAVGQALSAPPRPQP